ncbi:MAG: hypothetical protein GY787_30730 [Alteromonadales bacterium]|nr:hypothetical protein [Alteromonadales bacterium]
MFVSGVFSYLADENELISSLIASPRIKELAIVASGFYALFSTYRWLQALDNSYPDILQDINNEIVIDDTYLVEDVCRFQEPEQRGYLFV